MLRAEARAQIYTMVGIHVARCLVLIVCVVACVLPTAHDTQTCVSVILSYTCIAITHPYDLIEQYSRSGGSTVKLGLRRRVSHAPFLDIV